MTPPRLLLDERPLIVLPSLAVALDQLDGVSGLNAALVVQQLHWALGRNTALEVDGAKWLKADLAWWCGQFPFMGETTIRRTLKALSDAGIVLSRRGKEANVYSIAYDLLTVQIGQQHRPDRAVAPSKVDGAHVKREVGEKEEREQLGAEDGTLFAVEPVAAPKDAPKDEAKDEAVEKVWAHYVVVFGDRIRIKELTTPRKRTLSKALTAVGGDADVMKSAIDGLKSYRDSHPDGSKDVALSVIFETGPHDRQNLTEKIEFWASKSAGVSRSVDDFDIPASQRSTVMELRGTVAESYRHPDDDGRRERSESAQRFLRERFHMVPDHWDGTKLTWKKVD